MVTFMVRAVVEGGACVDQMNGICKHPLGNGCAESCRGGGVPAPSAPETWRRVDDAVPFAGDSVGRIITPGGIYYDTGQASVSAPR